MMFLYVCATVLTVFVGFRDAAGRNPRIKKGMYYRNCILKAFGLGQVFLGGLWVLAVLLTIDFSIVHAISERCFEPFLAYIAVVLITFVPYFIPNWEIKSLVTVLVFGPLTLIQPLVIVLTVLQAMFPYIDSHRECFFIAIGTLFCLLFERIIGRLGWAKKEAQIQ